MVNKANRCKVCLKGNCELKRLPKWLSVLSITFDENIYCNKHYMQKYNLSYIFMIIFWFINLSILFAYGFVLIYN